MDKETALEIERLKAATTLEIERLKVATTAVAKTVEELEKEHKKWTSLVRNVIVKSVTWLLLMGGSGMLFGWNMPPEVRKALLEWASK